MSCFFVCFFAIWRGGQVRYIGTSNDTPYGICKMAQIGERMGYPRVASVQVSVAVLEQEPNVLPINTMQSSGERGGVVL